MKNNKFEFPEFDDDIVENIAESYPDLSEAEKAQICRKAREKLDSADFKGDTVSGVEPAKKRSWIGWTSVAVAVFAVAIIPFAINALKNAPDVQEPETLADIDIEYSPGASVITDYIPPEDSKESVGTTPDAPYIPENPTKPATTENPENIIAEETESENETPPAPPENPEENGENPEPVVTAPQPAEPPEVTTWAVCSTPRKDTTPVTKPAVTTWAVCSTPRRDTTPIAKPAPKPIVTAVPAVPPPPHTEPSQREHVTNLLGSLTYEQYTCDGIPEYNFYGTDGNFYQLNFSSKWIWRNGTTEAVMTGDIYAYLMENMSCLEAFDNPLLKNSEEYD